MRRRKYLSAQLILNPYMYPLGERVALFAFNLEQSNEENMFLLLCSSFFPSWFEGQPSLLWIPVVQAAGGSYTLTEV